MLSRCRFAFAAVARLLVQAALPLLFAAGASTAWAFGFEEVAALARQQAAAPYVPPPRQLPPALAALRFEDYQDIRFKPARNPWRADGLPFELNFFHRNKDYPDAVEVHEVRPEGVRPLAFKPEDFDYGPHPQLTPKVWGALGFAGFRVLYPLHPANAYKDELVVFHGASYFRGLGAGQQYGLSARGLAIDTVGGNGREEFPRFKSFWLERPAPQATALTVYALLDSPRATGAYRFVICPGEQTVMDVQARLFLREGVATLGLAPLTSMFLHGENDPRPGQRRPEVHDSDGLMLAAGHGQGTEWLWRPLGNPGRPLASSFQVQRLAGFGLMQRDREAAHYQDPEARYERRPSAWVTPVGDWGPGRVELVQLPTPDDTNDNIVAYWVPAQPPAPGQPLDLAYQLAWQGDAQQRPPNGWTVQSRALDAKPGEFHYEIDFTGPALQQLPADAVVEAVASSNAAARLTEAATLRQEIPGTWRLRLRGVRLQAEQPVELRAFLRHGADALTETWTTLIAPHQ